MDFFSCCCIIYYSYNGNFVLFPMMPYTCSYEYWFKSYMPISNLKSTPTCKTVNMPGPLRFKQTAYFSLIHSFMEYGATVGDPYQKYNSDKVEMVQRQAAMLVKSRYTRYSSASDMLDEFGWLPLSKMRLNLFCFTKLLTVWLKCPSKASLMRRIRALEENTM